MLVTLHLSIQNPTYTTNPFFWSLKTDLTLSLKRHWLYPAVSMRSQLKSVAFISKFSRPKALDRTLKLDRPCHKLNLIRFIMR